MRRNQIGAQQADKRAAQRAYFIANGWPTNIDGTLTPLHMLDMARLRRIAENYARALQTEFDTITPGRKRSAA